MIELIDRYRGALVGLAVGDALGTTLEFQRPGSFEPITDMVGGGPFGLLPGQWTDDTSMAMCLSESLLQSGGFNPHDQMQRYLKWRWEGHWSSTGSCFDVGGTVSQALARFQRTGDPFSGSTDPYSAGNGALMRLMPVPLAFANEPSEAIFLAGEMSRTTHGAIESIDACRYFAGLAIGALKGESKASILAPLYHPVAGAWAPDDLAQKIASVAAGSFKTGHPPAIRGTGYVVESLEAALWAFHRTDDFETGALKAVNLGDDADTTGAIYGQLAGAFYGFDNIPGRWVDLLTRAVDIVSHAEQLLGMAEMSKAAHDG